MPNNSAQFSPCSLLPHVRPKVSAYENHNTVSLACSDAGFDGAYRMLHACEIRPRKDHRGVNLISDAFPFGRLWYGEPDAISNAVDYAKFRSRSHRAVTQIEKLNALPPRTQREYELFPKGEYALGRAWKSGGFPLSYFLSRMGDPMSSGVFLKK